MDFMKHYSCRLMATFAFMAAFATVLTPATANAQGGVTSSISGIVLDSSGGVIPGADVRAKNNGTGAESTTVTTEAGTFTIPALLPGSYAVTVTLQGFKTTELKNVTLNAATPVNLRITLQVGALEEAVVVVGESSPIVQTQATSIATTLNVTQVSNLPLTSRSALDFIVNIPGANTPGGSRDTTINGLPQSAINITLDGMNIQDNYLKTTDGFFTRVSPRLDAVEEVTVVTAGNGADSAGQGAVNIRFVTRSGTNRFSGSSYHYFRSDKLNANTWFNNRDLAPDPKTGKAPKDELLLNQPGTRAGGPVMIPGVFDGHDKMFFFVNYEESRSPSNPTRRRTILTPEAQRGLFTYTVGGGERTVDLFDLATRNGQIATLDPTTAKLLADIRSATQKGTVKDQSDPILQDFNYQFNSRNYTPYPTIRMDYNLSTRHRLTGSYNYQHINSTPDTTNTREPFFPGFPVTGSQQSTRWTTSDFLRSTFGTNMVNEFRVGATGGATLFSPELNADMWGGTGFGSQGGYYLRIDNACCGNNNSALTRAGNSSNFSAREASTKNFDDTLNWIKGSHRMVLGMAFTQGDVWLKNQQIVPEITFGIVAGDPAESMFNTTNFQGASNAQLDAARGLYSILTGRVSAINSAARFNEETGQYENLGLGIQKGRMRQWGFFLQDSWQARPNLTVNAGLRYELQMPFYPVTNSYTTGTIQDLWGVSGVNNLFEPGVTPGQKPAFQPYTKGSRAFNIDKNNFAPSLGLNFTPGSRGGFLGKLLGEEGDTVFRGAYSLAFERPGMSDYTAVFGANPGPSLNTSRSVSLGNLGTPLPVLLRETNRLGAPAYPATLTYPYTDLPTEDINIFDPNLQTPYSQTWTAGVQRKLSRNMAIDVRYVGTRHLQGWIEYNYNEADIVENGFLNEFRNAQANLQANIAAGRGSNFRYFGPGTGTVPLPIYLAYFSGIPSSRANDPSLYNSTLFANSGFVNPLARYNPNPFSPASASTSTTATGLYGDATRRKNALDAGLPANFFVANPDLLGGANLTGNGGYTRYDSLQLDMNKRLSKGIQVQANYVYGKAYSSSRYSFRTPRKSTLQTGSEGGVTHALKANYVWELPFGQGRRFLNHGGMMDAIFGGWSTDGIIRIQSGRMLDFGNVRLVGMTVDELRKAIKIRDYAVTGISSSAVTARYVLPQDIVENTFRAFSTSATSATGYGSQGAPSGRYLAPANGPDCIETASGFGDCGVRSLVVTGPLYHRFDISAVKKVRFGGRYDFQFRAEMINALNHPNFVPVIATSSTANNYRVTALQENSNRTVQLVSRFSW
jgi:carboxypeptidase family protein/TonB-dependent receptor-like protein